MKIMVDLCLIPIGVGVSLSSYIAQCLAILEEKGLAHSLHAYGTTIEGEWDEVMDAVKACFQTIHRMGAPRVHASMKIGSRTDRAQTMEDKVQSVRNKMPPGS